MASPVQMRPPHPPRSFAGPVVLITIGLIFLLGNLHIFSWEILAHAFSHYWPVLLILWGIIKLVEYQQAQRAGVRASGIGFGGVLLLLILIGFGMAATQASRLNWDELKDHTKLDIGDFPIFGHNYEYEQQVNQPFPAGGSLHVQSERGAINISVSTDDQLRVSAHKKISADKQSEADEANPKTAPQISVSGNTVTLDTNTRGSGSRWVSSDLDISLPRKASVTISSRHGDISITGRDGDIDINSQHGEVSVSDVNGKVALNLDESSANVSQVSSDVSVEGRANDVSIEDVKGSVRLSGDFMESVKLAKIEKNVSFKTERTDMEFSKLDGDLDLDSGDLRATDITGPIRLSTRSKDIQLDGVIGDLRIENENGSIEAHINKIGSTEITNRSGDIEVYVPDKAGFQLDAHARNGDIETDFSSIKVDSGDDQASAAGTVGNGGSRVAINNEHGAIELRKGSSVADARPMPAPKPPAPMKPEKSPEAVVPTEN